MDFLILGPMQVRNEAGVVALGGIKPRAVLAVLLLQANRPVSAERLALALWGEDAPGGAVKTVQVHVSRLRRALDDPEVIATTPAGYCLRVREGELDAARFEALVEDAREALAAGQPADAATILRQAVALWRGQALADLALEPFARAESARLEEQRLAAIELRVEADLAVGRHAEVVGELAQLVADHPTRERLSGQLMLALYRCGRQSDALDVYAAARRVLVDELGIEPGPELRDLHAAVLRQDVALQPDMAAGELPPALDPAASQPLVGRDAELARLLARWDSARTGAGGVVALVGPRGAGKSRLTQELAREVHGAGATVVHASGAGPADTILVALGRVRAATRPLLLVLDDVDRAGSGVRTELAGLALDRAHVLVVACAQDRLALTHVEAADTLELGALDAEAVRAIAARYAPGRPLEEVPAEWLLDASGGVARRVHEAAGQWARREAARHVGAVADRAVAGRAELRLIEAELTGGVVDLQQTRERSRPRDDDSVRVVCPFKGLASYDIADARYFFGRERLVAEIVARLVGAPLLGVVGPSGSGKSSVLRAGLLPALAGGVLPGSEDWAQALMRPGAHPMRELGVALADAPAGRRLVLAVDQFEETFTVCEDEAERAEFISELVHAADGADERYLVVLALRADHYGRCAAYPELARLLAASNVLVHPMLHDELLRAIERPAEVAGLRIEADLVDALVADVEREPGGLPLLSTALLELWQRRDGRRLRHAVYVRMGGVHGAVARLAETAYGELDEGQRAIARRVLMRMVTAGDGDTVERRRVALAELETERDGDLARVVALLTDRRLLTVSAGTVELAHEALLREWPRLAGWIDEDRDELRIRRALSAAARDWDGLRRDEGALYRGARLRETVQWDGARRPSLSVIEREFLRASELVGRRERSTRRRRVALVLAALTTALVAVIGIVIAAVFTHRQHDIAASRDLATKSASIVGSDPAVALAIARAALDRHDTQQAENAFRQATFDDRATAVARAATGIAFSIAFSRDGQRIATTGEDATVRIWNRDGRELLATLKGARAPVLGASFSPDGKRVASVSADGEVAIADPDGGHRDARRLLLEKAVDGTPDAARSVQYSRDGSQLLVATVLGVVGVIPVSGPAKVRVLGRHGDRARASFSPDGKHVVSAGEDGIAQILDVARKQPPIVLAHGRDIDVLAARFSPDGRLVATASDDGALRIWDARDGARIRTIQVDGDALLSVRFDATMTRLVTGGEDGVVRISDVEGGPAISSYKGHAGLVYDAAFVPRSRGIVSVGQDGTLRSWSPLDVAALEVPGTGKAPTSPSVSPDGTHVVSGYRDGRVRIWTPATGGVRALPGFAALSRAAYSVDGAYIVSAGGYPGKVRLWDVRHGRSQHVPSPRGENYAVAVGPAGRRVAIATINKPTVVENPDGSEPATLEGHTNDVVALAFTRDGRYVASGSEDGTARIWRSSDGRNVRTLTQGKTVTAVAFSRDGGHLATASTDGTLRIWPVTAGAPVLLYGHDGPVTSIAFDPSGRLVVSAGKDGTVRVWHASGGETLVVLRRDAQQAAGAAFRLGATTVVSAGDDGVLRITPCEVCGGFDDVLRLAASRAAPTLDPDQRAQLLSGSG